MTNQEAIKYLKPLHTYGETKLNEAAYIAIEALQAQKTGHWIKKIILSTLGYYECECSECGRMWQYREGWNYCPNCGCKMEVKNNGCD